MPKNNSATSYQKRARTHTNNIGCGLLILAKYATDFDMDSVPRAYPNGTAMHSHSVYIQVEADVDVMPEQVVAKLKELGWSEEYPHWCYCYG